MPPVDYQGGLIGILNCCGWYGMVCNWLGVAQFLVEDDNMTVLFGPGLRARVVSTLRACNNVLPGHFYQ